MNIGILTFYREINFGANLQALSTYAYFKKHGHKPIFINYCSKEKEGKWGKRMENEPQPRCHIEFVDSTLSDQTEVCRNAVDINGVIKKYKIEAIVVGSDAVLQHHPLRDRIDLSKRIKSLWSSLPESTFPNPFWGVGIDNKIKMAIMSASCQDSEFYHFSKRMKKDMSEALNRFCYISVRDSWTQDMVKALLGEDKLKDISITPDPVFNFNENVSELIPSRQYILVKFHLPNNYVLISMFGQHLDKDQLKDLKTKFHEEGLVTVALPVQMGMMFKHPFDYEIPIPLNPLDWYALIKYSNGYIGSNMHPIVVALHNAVPCFALDFYGKRNFLGMPKREMTSKVFHIMSQFHVEMNHRMVIHGKSAVNTEEIVEGIKHFPVDAVRTQAADYSQKYHQMMTSILSKMNSTMSETLKHMG